MAKRSLYLNSNGQLSFVDDESCSRVSIEQHASTLSAFVGADARFAIRLSDSLETAVAGSSLSAAVATAAREDAVTCAGVWDNPAADIIIAHAIRGAVVRSSSTLAESSPPNATVPLPTAEYTWDEVRLKSLIQFIGGPTFVVNMLLYVVWRLDEAAARAHPLRQALFNMVYRSGDNTLLRWQTWEALWNNLETALARARRSNSESFRVMYPSTSFFGNSLLFIRARADSNSLPTAVDTRLPSSLIRRLLSDDLSLTKLMCRMPHNAAAIDAVRFVADDEGKLRILCYQTRVSDVGRVLSWKDSCDLVKLMRVWLVVAAWTATCRPPEVPASPLTDEQQHMKMLWSEMGGCAGGEQTVPVEAGWWEDAGNWLSDRAAVHTFVDAEWSKFPPSSSTPQEVARAVSSVLMQAVFIVAVCRPRGKSFLAESTDAPSYMRRAIVVTSKDLPIHAGDFLSTIVGDCGRTTSSSVSVQREAGFAD